MNLTELKTFTHKVKPKIVNQLVEALSHISKLSQGEYIWTQDALKKFADFAEPGKMIRGMLVVLAAGKKLQNNKVVYQAAAAIEAMHSAILIHDDIIDKDEMRRGKLTLHLQYANAVKNSPPFAASHYGSSMAISVGIIGYFAGMSLLKNIPHALQKYLIELYSSEMALLGLAEMEDIDASSNNLHATEQAIMRIYEQKTGRYTFSLPLLAGFGLAGRTDAKLRKSVYSIGKEMGILFQLRDDMLGAFGDSSKTGKSVGGDVREKKRTWLYFSLCGRASSKDKKLIAKLYAQTAPLTKAQQAEVMAMFKKYQIEDSARDFLREQMQKCSRLAKKVGFGPFELKVFEQLIYYIAVREK